MVRKNRKNRERCGIILQNGPSSKNKRKISGDRDTFSQAAHLLIVSKRCERAISPQPVEPETDSVREGKEHIDLTHHPVNSCEEQMIRGILAGDDRACSAFVAQRRLA